MIVDELRAASVGFRYMARGAQIIRVPWEVCPLTDRPNGVWGLYWQGWNEHLKGLVPTTGHGTVDTSWWRPPYESFIIVSEKSEPGCVVVTTRPENFANRNLITKDGKTAEWAAQVSMVAMNQNRRPMSLLTLMIYSIDGEMADWFGARSSATVAVQSVVDDGEFDADALDRLDSGVRDLWAAKPKEHELDVANMMGTVSITCALLCCKNVELEEVRRDQKLQKARVKRGELPLVSWHVLKVGGLKRKHHGGGGGTGEALALHWVRGHFKHFTEEKKLFGRVTGSFWWTPHLAGQADRVVLKDYEVADVRD